MDSFSGLFQFPPIVIENPLKRPNKAVKHMKAALVDGEPR